MAPWVADILGSSLEIHDGQRHLITSQTKTSHTSGTARPHVAKHDPSTCKATCWHWPVVAWSCTAPAVGAGLKGGGARA